MASPHYTNSEPNSPSQLDNIDMAVGILLHQIEPVSVDSTPEPEPEPSQPPTLPEVFTTEAERLEDTAAWVQYVQDRDAGAYAPPASRRSAEKTDKQKDLILRRDPEAVVSPGQIPHGLGEFQWLRDEVDGPWADELGFDSPEQVELARGAGIFTKGSDDAAGPQTIWFPDLDFFNPVRQPIGDGYWAFALDGDRDHAWLNVGGQEDGRNGQYWTMHGVAQPTAQDIFTIRQAVRQANQDRSDFLADGADADDVGDAMHDITDGINIVWIPDEENPEQPVREGHGIGERDSVTRIIHDPLNGGENDQTGDSSARYYSIEFHGKSFTLDRDRAMANKPQPHKRFIVTSDGTWTEYSKYNELDWSNKKSVEKMNKWKEQQLGRHGWPPKRKEGREDYRPAERQWLMDLVAEWTTRQQQTQKHEKVDFFDLAAKFNDQFPETHREYAGISTLWSRLKIEYNKYGGLNPNPNPRTAPKKNKDDDKGSKDRQTRSEKKQNGGGSGGIGKRKRRQSSESQSAQESGAEEVESDVDQDDGEWLR